MRNGAVNSVPNDVVDGIYAERSSFHEYFPFFRRRKGEAWFNLKNVRSAILADHNCTTDIRGHLGLDATKRSCEQPLFKLQQRLSRRTAILYRNRNFFFENSLMEL